MFLQATDLMLIIKRTKTKQNSKDIKMHIFHYEASNWRLLTSCQFFQVLQTVQDIPTKKTNKKKKCENIYSRYIVEQIFQKCFIKLKKVVC